MKLSLHQQGLLLKLYKLGGGWLSVPTRGSLRIASQRRTMHSLARQGLAWVRLPNDSHYTVRISSDGINWIESSKLAELHYQRTQRGAPSQPIPEVVPEGCFVPKSRISKEGES